jgi:hypothetical protein
MSRRFDKVTMEGRKTEKDLEELGGAVVSIYMLDEGPAVSVREDFAKFFLTLNTENQTNIVEDFTAALREMFARVMNDSKDPH